MNGCRENFTSYFDVADCNGTLPTDVETLSNVVCQVSGLISGELPIDQSNDPLLIHVRTEAFNAENCVQQNEPSSQRQRNARKSSFNFQFQIAKIVSGEIPSSNATVEDLALSTEMVLALAFDHAWPKFNEISWDCALDDAWTALTGCDVECAVIFS